MKSNIISTNSIISQNKDIVASDIDDEKVMMSMEKGYYYGLDSIGRSVWDLIEKPMAVSDLINALLLQFDVDRKTCERDVLAFLEELNADGIVQVQ
ncbi:MAG: lasso peptide biosynthesis PqqD family chaperone [Desulfobacteraceae bacterium]